MKARDVSVSSALGHVAALDGIRALAVLAVLGYHGGVGWLGGGFLGVSAFFTLSGFLITSLLVREWERSESIDLRRFWSRRFRRLLPASWATIGLVLMMGTLGIWDVQQLRSLRGDVPWSLAELVNWHFIAQGQEYAQSVALPSPLLHYWSLAIEQQFYLLLPVLLTVVLGAASRFGARSPEHGRRVLMAVLLVAVAASATANGLYARSSVERAYFGTDTRAAEMLLGALLAVATTTHLRFSGAVPRRAAPVAGFAGLIGLGWMITAAAVPDAWLYPWGLLATALCTVAVILGAVQPGLFGRGLSFGPLVALGRISYGVYLVHWPVFLWLSPERTNRDGVSLLALRVAVTLGVAAASYRWLERPIRTGSRLRASSAVRLVPTTAVILLAWTLVVTNDLPAPPSYLQPRDEQPPETREPEIREPGTGPTSTLPAVAEPPPSASSVPAPSVPPTSAPVVRPSRVLLVGDSVAASIEDALGETLVSFGVAFGSAAAPGCGVITGLITDEQGRVSEMTRPCDSAIPRRQLESVAAVRPDLVLVMSSWEMTNREVDGVWYPFGTQASDEVITRLLGEAVDRLSSGGAAVALVSMPEPVDGRTQKADAVEVSRSRHLSGLLERVAETHPARVTTVAFDEMVCPLDPCPVVLDGLELRAPDGRHFDDPSAARWASERLTERVLGIDLAAL